MLELLGGTRLAGPNKQPDFEWHLLIGEQRYGPLSFEQLIEFVEQNGVQPDDFVWRTGWPEWKPLDTIMNPSASSTPPISPAPPATKFPQQFPRLEADNSYGREKPAGNYLVRHWRGQLSLGVTYWLIFFLPSLLTASGISLLVFLNRTPGGPAFHWIAIAISVFFSGLFVWQIVGLWRSASNHRMRGGKRIWALLAKIVVTLSVFCFAVVMVRTGMTVIRSMTATQPPISKPKPAAQAKNPLCPILTVSHAVDAISKNRVTFMLDLAPLPPEPDRLVFFWAITEGKIMSGQMQRSIVVEAPRGSLVTASVEVDGLETDCGRFSSDTAVLK